MKITADLLMKHDRPGPRYTSYPTAPVWTDAFKEADYQERLAAANRERGKPLALYVHIPYCESLCWYCGCSVVISKNRKKGSDYVDLVAREVATLARHLPDRRQVGQHHWGGGTPTFLPPEELQRLYRAITAHFPSLPDAEVSIEVHPAVTSVEQLQALREVGFNRLSMGVQDFTPEVQEAIHRHQGEEQTANLIAAARKLGFLSINVDLVYGLPYQTVAGFGSSIDAVLRMGIDRVVCYSYAHVPWLKKHQRVIPEAALPKGPAKFELFATAWQKFTDAGFVSVGMDHFARREDEMARALEAGTLHRNFMGYTTKKSDDMVAFGVTSIADVAGAFVQSERELPLWQAAVEAGRLPVHKGWRRTADDEARRAVILDLMCRFRVRYAEHPGFAERFAPELERLRPFEAEGMLVLGPDGIAVTEVGRAFIRNVCMVFDAYLPQQQSKPVFSRTV